MGLRLLLIAIMVFGEVPFILSRFLSGTPSGGLR